MAPLTMISARIVRPIAPLLTLTLLVSGCGEPQRLTLESGPVPLVAAGPLFEGSNTAQGTWAPGLDAFLAAHGHTGDDLRDVRLVAATLAGADSLGLEGIRSVSVQWTSDDEGMRPMAVRNPLPSEPGPVALTVAQERSDLADLLLGGAITVVADLDLEADSETDRHVIGSFTLELTLDP